MISLSRAEIMNLSQIVTSSKIRHAPNVFAFTEQGVSMLSSVLRSNRAIQVNIAIMRAFVKLRKILSTHKEFARKLNELERKVTNHDENIHVLFKAIKGLMVSPEKPKKRIGFTAKEKRAKYRAKKI